MTEGGRKEPILCPSSTAKEGAILLGIVGPEGEIGYIPQRLAIDKEFVETANNGRSPEKRFRFSSPCVMSACRQWKDARCGVIDSALELMSPVPERELPECSIRPQCRWYDQHGRTACMVCPLVITDVSDAQKADFLSEDFKGLLVSDAVGSQPHEILLVRPGNE